MKPKPKSKTATKTATPAASGAVIKAMPLNMIKTDPKNCRVHSEANIQAIMRSLKRFKQQKPIVVTKDFVCIAGNGTLEGARRLGWPTLGVLVTTLNENEAKAYGIADNKTGDLSEFDYKRLSGVLGDLKKSDVDLLDTGFQDFELEPILTDGGETKRTPKDRDGEASDKLFRVPAKVWGKLEKSYNLFRDRANLTNDTEAICLILQGKFGGK